MKKVLFIFLIPLFFFMASNVDAKDFGYGIKREKDHQVPNPGREITKIFDECEAYYVGNTNEKEIYLTFDAGYENGCTQIILDTLSKTNVKAAFFLTVHYLDANVELVKRMAKEGHVVGIHTVHHPDICHLKKEKLKEEIGLLEQKYLDITGEEMAKFFRPPEGTFNAIALETVKSLGYKSIFWSLAYVDWKVNERRGKEYAYNYVVNNVHNGAIILLHSVSMDNAEALEKIIVDLEKDGYVFKSLYDLKKD